MHKLAQPSASPVARLTTFQIPTNSFEEVALDFVGSLALTAGGNDFLLNITDRLTKVVVPIPCSQSIGNHELAHALFHHVNCRCGIPIVLLSERDPRIDNEFSRSLPLYQGTSQTLTTAHFRKSMARRKQIRGDFLL